MMWRAQMWECGKKGKNERGGIHGEKGEKKGVENMGRREKKRGAK